MPWPIGQVIILMFSIHAHNFVMTGKCLIFLDILRSDTEPHFGLLFPLAQIKL